MDATNPTPTNSTIVAAYRARTPGSATLAADAAGLFPSGVTHDSRHLEPYGIYVERAEGAHKWDVDGHRYVDFFGGHGALILGHGHPKVVAAAREAMNHGTQFAAGTRAEIAWAEAIRALVPGTERVRFTSSGTEATLMALRLARAFTGRDGIVRFKGHFHGWHDHMTSGYSNHFDGSPTPGVLDGVASAVRLLPPGDLAAAEALFARDPDIAAVIIEPTGASFGQAPIRPDFLHGLRRLTERHGILLIFDEVVTGFRVSPGGAQVAFGVRPDLSTWAKILAGGLPGAAVTGRRDVLDHLDFAASAAAGREKIGHPGTYNANPVSAAAGAAALTVIAETDVNYEADACAADLRHRLNEMLAEDAVPWAAYGTSSGFHLFLNPAGRPITPTKFDPFDIPPDELKSMPAQLVTRMRVALLVQGVDTNSRLGGFTSGAHTPDDVTETVAGFREAIRMLRAEGELA